MTLKAFAEKYGIKYTLAVEASVYTPQKPTSERDFDFIEKDLYLSLMRVLSERIGKFDKKIFAIRKMQKEVKNVATRSGILT